MTSPSLPGVTAHGRAAVPAAPTWRDLPPQPPYGDPRLAVGPGPAAAFAPPPEPEASAITPGQIALAVGGTLLLIAIGIGAALWLLDDDEQVAETTSVTAAPTPEDPAAAPDEPDPDPADPGQNGAQGELEPQPDGGIRPDDLQPDDLQPDEPRPDAPQAPGGAPLPLPDLGPADPGAEDDEEEAADLPRLFRLRTLPAGTAEGATTVSQTSEPDRPDDEGTVTEQVTMVSSEDGEIAVRATRATDADERLHAQLNEDAEEVSVRGTPAFLLDGQRLLWLAPGPDETLVEIDAPPAVGTDALLTIAQGLELLR